MSSTEIPLELIWRILELLALEVPAKAIELVLISKAVQKVIDPILYSVLVIQNMRSLSLLARTMRTGSKSKEFYRQHTRTLCVAHIVSPLEWPVLSDIMASCPGLSSLAIWAFLAPECIFTTWLRSESVGYFSRLCRLSLRFCYDAPPVNILAHYTPCITHLDLFTPSKHPLEQWADVLKSLPKLTHLILMSFATLEQTVPFLQSHLPPSIRVCILKCNALALKALSRDWVRRYIEDPSPFVLQNETLSSGSEDLFLLTKFARCLVNVQCTKENFTNGWGHQHNTGDNIWEQAEEVLALKQSTILVSEE